MQSPLRHCKSDEQVWPLLFSVTQLFPLSQ